jgi:ABC-type hemin transport system substrate-binding protein
VIIEWGSRPLPPRLTELSERRGWAVRRVTLLTIDDIARTVDDLAIGLGAVSMRTNAPRRPEGVPEDLEGLSGAIRFEDPASRFDAALPSATLARAWSRRGDGFAGVGPVLLLGSTTPPGVLGPGSFHDQILRRVGGVPAIDTGAPWMELDAEDVLRLDPAAIVLISPRGAGTPPASPSLDALRDRLGRLGTLNIRAVREGRIALIDDPLALLPSTAMAGFADRLAEILGAWEETPVAPGP